MEFIPGPKCDDGTPKCLEQILRFDVGDLHLQEPMAFVTNTMIAITALVLYLKIKNPQTAFEVNWKRFYIIFSISVFFGGLGHLFFQYFGIPGKFPCWITGVFASYFAGKAMLSVNIFSESKRSILHKILLVKCIVLGVLSIVFGNFLFITADAVGTYLFFAGLIGFIYWQKGYVGFKYFVFAIIVLLPSIFIFLLRLNPHIWFNKEDLSHILMIFTIILFYFGINYFQKQHTELDLKAKA